jgi:hypothetical protein
VWKIRNQTLTDGQYDDYARLAGRMTKMNLNRIVNSSQWAMIAGAQKADVIMSAFNGRRAAAENVLPGVGALPGQTR